jgi:hypothetical protein
VGVHAQHAARRLDRPNARVDVVDPERAGPYRRLEVVDQRREPGDPFVGGGLGEDFVATELVERQRVGTPTEQAAVERL